MGWQRQIPFGYRMAGGKIVSCPIEAEAVAFIYARYRQGDSYLTIAEAMSKRDIRYHNATGAWNKHMVKRILENPKYAGLGEYPPLLPRDVWHAAQTVRSGKTAAYIGQTPAVRMLKRRMMCGVCGAPIDKHTRTNASGKRWWYCSAPECPVRLTLPDHDLERTVTGLLNRLVASPDLLEPREAHEQPASFEAARIQNEIYRELGKPELDEDHLASLIFTCAEEKYAALGGGLPEGKISALKEELGNRAPLTEFDAALFAATADTLLVMAGSALALRTVGGNIILENGRRT